MRNCIFLLLFLLLNCCHSGHNATKKAKETFIGFEKVIDNPDSIPEIIPVKNNMVVIDIPENIENSSIEFSSIVDSVYYVRLQTIPESLIGSVDKVLFVKDKIVIIERRSRQSALLFTKDGKFLTKIGKQGNGPGEYNTILDVAIDPLKGDIIIMDDYGRKLLYYDENGNFLNYKKIYYYTSGLSILFDGSIIFYQNRKTNLHIPSVNTYNLLFAQPDQNITGKALSFAYLDKFPKNKMGSLYSFNVSGPKVLFNPVFTNTIYEITGKNQVEAKYTINIGSKDIVRAFNKETRTEDIPNLLNTKKYYYFQGESVLTDNFLYFKIDYAGHCFYSKSTKYLFYGKTSKVNSSINDRILIFVPPVTSKEKYFVGVIWPYKIIKNLQVRQLNKYIRNQLNDLKEDDNPILFFYSLKSI